MKLIIVIPAFNEDRILETNIDTLVEFCNASFSFDWQIIIADNNSIDDTAIVAKELAGRYHRVDYVYTPQKGKGAAIKSGWHKVKADIYCFMDADLATSLSCLPALIQAIDDGADCAIGSRFIAQAKVKRDFFRAFFSHGYRLAAKVILKTKINDLPCGFKAFRAEVIEQVLPQATNQSWFFDSELVVLAEKNNFKIVEVPVIWEDVRPAGDKSRVNILSLSLAYLKQLIALRRKLKYIK